mgnify:CR=1 FL=1
MKKNKKRVTAILLCVLVLAGCLTVLQTVSASRKASTPVSAACLTLEPTTLQSTVTASGTVKSASTTNVYTLVNGCVVKDVHVEVGDTVQAGDILCQLDSSTLEDSLEKQRLRFPSRRTAPRRISPRARNNTGTRSTISITA